MSIRNVSLSDVNQDFFLRERERERKKRNLSFLKYANDNLLRIKMCGGDTQGS